MTVKLQDLQDRTWEKLKDRGADRRTIDDAVSLAVEGVGFHIYAGEVCDPRPPPSTLPRQQNVRWSGGRRRR